MLKSKIEETKQSFSEIDNKHHGRSDKEMFKSTYSQNDYQI